MWRNESYQCSWCFKYTASAPVTFREKLSFQLSGAAASALQLINGVSNAKLGKDQQHYIVVVHGRSQAQRKWEEGHMTGAECWVSVGEGYFEQLTAADA
jgi:hypothetical protein